MTDASAYVVTAAGTTASRTLASRSADIVNVKDYGAVMDGTTVDTPAYQSAYAAMPSVGGIVDIPTGNLKWPGFVTTNGQSILWRAMGPLVSGTGPSLVTSMGDGDVFEGFTGGRKYISKTITNNISVGYATLEGVMYFCEAWA